MKPLTSDLQKQFQADFDQQVRYQIARTAASHNGLDQASKSVSAERINNNTFSIDLETGKVPNQRRSGRCWLFAHANVLREAFLKVANSDDKSFELSQTYLYFYDKLEKANYFYHNIIKTADLALDSREVAHLLSKPQEDGGQWDMVVSIVEKYGIVPQSVMPDTANSKDSSALNTYLNKKLRKDAKVLRDLIAEGADEAKLDQVREGFLTEIYRICAIALGTPPERFDFEYRDADKEYHHFSDLTPKSFYDQFIGVNLEDYVSIINAPTSNKPLNKTFTVDLLGNVVGGRQIKYLNVDMATFKDLAIKQLADGESVWFGCDVGKFSTRDTGLMSTETYQIDDLVDVNFSSNKCDRLEYGESLLTHAMVLTGVDVVNGQPTKWKVQNSWGEDIGHKGFFVATDAWMDEYTYQVVINKKHLSPELLALFEQEPIVLPAWDPMGSLA